MAQSTETKERSRSRGGSSSRSSGNSSSSRRSSDRSSNGGEAKAGGKDAGSNSGAGRSRTNPNTNAEDRNFLERYASKLSKSTQRARWIHSNDEHAERNGQTLATRSGDVIRGWADARGGTPATAGANVDPENPRTLRFDFPGFGGRNLVPVSWDAWLRTF